MTGTALSIYFDWLQSKLKVTEYGTISMSFTICDGQVTRVDKQINETDKFQLTKKQS